MNLNLKVHEVLPTRETVNFQKSPDITKNDDK